MEHSFSEDIRWLVSFMLNCMKMANFHKHDESGDFKTIDKPLFQNLIRQFGKKSMFS